MNMITRLDHIPLAMPPDEENKARAFWCDVLGLAGEVSRTAFATDCANRHR
jgi:hypothetical protein